MKASQLTFPSTSYFQTLYRNNAKFSYADMDILYADKLRVKSKNFTKDCSSMKDGVLHNNRCGWQGEWDPPNTIFVYKNRSNSPLSPGSRIEVTHCEEQRKLRLKHARSDFCKRKSCFENTTTWMFVTKGSGVFYDIGRTIHFSDPLSALRINKLKNTDFSAKNLEILWKRLKNKYDVVQFTDFKDQRCGISSHILVDLRVSGFHKSSCTLMNFTNFNGEKCSCLDQDGCIICT